MVRVCSVPFAALGKERGDTARLPPPEKIVRLLVSGEARKK